MELIGKVIEFWVKDISIWKTVNIFCFYLVILGILIDADTFILVIFLFWFMSLIIFGWEKVSDMIENW